MDWYTWKCQWQSTFLYDKSFSLFFFLIEVQLIWMLIKHHALPKLNTCHKNIFLKGYTKLYYEPLWNTMNHHDLLCVTMSHYDPKHIHYDPLSPTINHSEPLWCNVFPLWATMTQYGPTFDIFILPQNGVGYVSIFLFCETSRYFILNKTWFKKVFKSAYFEFDNCLLKLFPQITFLWWIGFRHFKVLCCRWDLVHAGF